MAAEELEAVEGGPVVFEFQEPEPKQRRTKPKIKREPERQPAKQELLSAKQFVDKYRREAKTASWDHKALRKCGRGAEQILMTLGAHKRKQPVPLHEQIRRRQLQLNRPEPVNFQNPGKKTKKRPRNAPELI
jgi:hypothetical protein